MRAIQMHAFGSPEVLRLVDLPDPEPAAGQVRVRLGAAGVNPADTYVRSGTYAFLKPTLPYTPGWDGAGTVDRLGEGVDAVREGDRVFVAALRDASSTGTYAESVVCDASSVHALPDTATFAEGAAIGVPCAAAWYAVHLKARPQPGETVLVHGASGGVGIPAVQMCRALGARVIGTADTAESMALVRQCGAHHVLDHSAAAYMARIPDLTSGRGIDVVIEMLANVNLERDLEVLAMRGRVVIVGSRGSLTFTPRLTMIKEATVHGMALWNATEAEWHACTLGVAAALEAGVVRPVVGREIPLAEAARAHVEVLSEGTRGKLVLVM